MRGQGWLWINVLLALTPAQPPTAGPAERRLPAKVDLGPEFARLGLESRAQGSRDTCSLFAITAVADFETARSDPALAGRLSEEFLIWAANEATGCIGDQAMFSEAVHGLNVLGVCEAGLMAYESSARADRRPSPEALRDAKLRSGRWNARWIKRWDVGRGLGATELDAIKGALADGHPVACGLRWPKTLRGASLLQVPTAQQVFDGHSIVFVGYEDRANAPGGGVLSFRNSFGPRWGKRGTGVMSYGYARAYANDALWLECGPTGSELPTERIEAETATIAAVEKGTASPQEMARWGGSQWSGGRQLFCRVEDGGGVELAFDVRRAGRYRVRVRATAAPDYGTIRVALDGVGQPPNFDLYSGRVSPTGPLELGVHELTAGRHTLRITATGKVGRAKDCLFGLDTIDLIATK